MNLDLKSLIDKLNPTCRNALEGAAQLCVTQTHYNVEVEHLLVRLLDAPDSDMHRVLRYYEIKTEDVSRELVGAMDGFKRGNSRTPAMSAHILTLVQKAWLISSLQFSEESIRSGALLMALLDNESLLGLLVDACPTLLKIPRERLREDLREIARTSSEETESGGTQASDDAEPVSTSSISTPTAISTNSRRPSSSSPVECPSSGRCSSVSTIRTCRRSCRISPIDGW